MAVAALAASLPACSALPADDRACELQRVLSLPLRRQAGHMVVPVQVEGRPATMVLDTGAERTTLSAGAVTRLGLARDAWVSTQLAGVGGTAEAQRNAQLRFGLGGVELPGLSMSVTALDFLDRTDPPIAGLLGGDVLSRFDVELDLPAGRMSLWTAENCRRAYAAWQGRYASVPLRRSGLDQVTVELHLNGSSVTALVDTGASTSVLTSWGAARLGVDAAALRDDPVSHGAGIGPQHFAVRLHRFRSLAVGADQLSNVSLAVGEFRLEGTQMLLGADYLGTRRVWLSYTHGEMLVQTPVLAGMADSPTKRPAAGFAMPQTSNEPGR